MEVGIVVRSAWLVVAAVALAMVVGFGAGYVAGRQGPVQLPILTGSGYVGGDQATLQAGDVFYGFESSVAWRDASGSEHEGGWPDCLPKLQSVQGVRFAGGDLRWGDTGIARVVWVDCQR